MLIRQEYRSRASDARDAGKPRVYDYVVDYEPTKLKLLLHVVFLVTTCFPGSLMTFSRHRLDGRDIRIYLRGSLGDRVRYRRQLKKQEPKKTRTDWGPAEETRENLWHTCSLNFTPFTRKQTAASTRSSLTPLHLNITPQCFRCSSSITTDPANPLFPSPTPPLSLARPGGPSSVDVGPVFRRAEKAFVTPKLPNGGGYLFELHTAVIIRVKISKDLPDAGWAGRAGRGWNRGERSGGLFSIEFYRKSEAMMFPPEENVGESSRSVSRGHAVAHARQGSVDVGCCRARSPPDVVCSSRAP